MTNHRIAVWFENTIIHGHQLSSEGMDVPVKLSIYP